MSERAPAPRIPATIVTGFLGSGKTTLMNAALRDPSMHGALVIINEFGEVPLDHVLVASSSDSIVVLENGCLCCTVFGDLIGTLNSLYHRREAGEIPHFDRVVIETSGLADPTSIVQAFLSDPTLEGLYRLGSVITVVDTVNIGATLVEYDEAVRQIALADHLILTKLDLAPTRSEREQEIRHLLTPLNATARFVAVDAADLDLAALLCWDGHDPAKGAEEAKHWLAATEDSVEVCGDHDHSHHHDHRHHDHRHMPIGSLSYVREEPLPQLALQLLLEGIERNLGPALLRLKAIVTVEGQDEGPAVIQGAQHLLHNITWLKNWPFPDRKSRFVLIAAGIERGRLSEMVMLLDRIATRSAKARAAVD
jgi:G3E family GTPase